MSNGNLKFDEVGLWSEIKLEILRKYAYAYSTILSSQSFFKHIYIDAFAGAGIHLRKETHEPVLGSPLLALEVEPKFQEYHFIDLDKQKTEYLESLVGRRDDVKIYNEDCNEILLTKIFPLIKWEEYKRALCILDPYGLNLKWEVIEYAGKLRTIDMFLNFPIYSMNRNAIWKCQEKLEKHCTDKMDSYWGDTSWKEKAYEDELTLFGTEKTKLSNKSIAEEFRKRLVEVGRFKHVPEPIPMKNKTGSIIYYLFFASQNKNAARIANDIFKKYR